MRLPKISIKKCFLLILGFAVLVLFGFSLRERDIWKTKDSQIVTAGDASQQQQTLQETIPHHSQTQEQSSASLLASIKHNEINYQIDNLKLNQQISSPSTSSSIVIKKPKQINAVPDNLVEDDIIEEYVDNNNNDNAIVEQTNAPEFYEKQMKIKPWYFVNGKRWPTELPSNNYRNKKLNKKRLVKLFPHEDLRTDRITNQLMFVPPKYEQIKNTGKLKTILLFNGLGSWNVKQGRETFLNSKCPVSTCKLTSNRDLTSKADLVLYKDHFIPTGVLRPPKQIYMLYFLECPYHTQNIKFPDVFNWTSTYRKDSDVVAPYEKWEYYDPMIKQIEQDHNYAKYKTKKVAWFVSNCGARNGRLQYAHELQKYIQVDIYGSCGTFKCSRSTSDKCFDILDRDYKFYLAFENSNCKDYITEKFFVNALNRNILPIVMGARPEDYEISAPYRSYIHVDEFASAKELAEYLLLLDKNDELYNSYFKWKGTGEFINTYFWCRVCSMLHDEYSLEKPKWYEDVNDWWRGPGVCTNGSWRNYQARKDIISDD